MTLPTGTVTFLLTDVEGSTRAWERHGEVKALVLARQAELLAQAVSRYGGARPEEQGEGDSVFAAFARATDAVAAAVEAQRALGVEPWPDGIQLRVRMALHTGDGVLRGERNYGGLTVHRTARVRSLAQGGQVLVTGSTATLVAGELPAGIHLRDLGEHRLRDLSRPERLYQLAGEGLADDAPPLRIADAGRGNLPTPLTTFVGRSAELLEVSELLATNRLVTLTGTGGAGKTRLAQQAAREASSGTDAVWWVELATLTEPDAVGRHVLSTVGGREESARSALDVLVEQFGGSSTLVVLDNCEHLVDTVAPFVADLLSRCPLSTVLTTTRESLGVPGEVVYRVPSLGLDDGTADPSDPAELVELAASFDAVALFVDRARLVRPRFVLDETTVGPIMEICRRLDALPLGIELAAARVRMMSPAAIAEALRDRFRVLGGGVRTVMARQQTLRASVDWSYALLSPAEQTTLGRLSVFVGSFSLSAAEAVAGDGDVGADHVLDSVERLVDKSLVQAEPEGDEPTYRLLETIRQYAGERLFDAGELTGARDRHLRWHADRSAQAAAGLESPQHARWVAVLSEERPNVTAAFDWAVESGDAARMWSMCGALTFWWASTGQFGEAQRWFEDCLAATDAVDDQAQLPARWGATHLALYGGEFERGLVLGEETLAMAGAIGDERYIARALSSVGTVMIFVDPSTGERQLRQAIEMTRRLDDRWCLADALQNLSFLHIGRGELGRAEVLLEESQPIARHLDSPQLLAWDHGAQGLRLMRLGELEQAVEAFDVGMREAGRTDDPNIVGTLLAWRAMCEASMGHPQLWVEPMTDAIERCLTVGAGQALLVVVANAVPVRLAAGDVGEAEALISQWLAVIESAAPALAATMAPPAVASALAAGDHSEARRRAQVARLGAEASGSAVATAAARLAESVIDLLEGEVAKAEATAREVLPVFASGPFRLELVDTLALLGGTAAAADRPSEAARLWGAADALAAGHRIAWTPLRQWAEAGRDSARLVDPGRFDAAQAEGASLSLEQAIDSVLAG